MSIGGQHFHTLSIHKLTAAPLILSNNRALYKGESIAPSESTDLNVAGPADNRWTASWDNSNEIVNLTAVASGYFQIKLRKFRFNGVSEFIAVAWNL